MFVGLGGDERIWVHELRIVKIGRRTSAFDRFSEHNVVNRVSML